MLFTLQLDVSPSTPITVSNEVIKQILALMLLGVKLDNHLHSPNMSIPVLRRVEQQIMAYDQIC